MPDNATMYIIGIFIGIIIGFAIRFMYDIYTEDMKIWKRREDDANRIELQSYIRQELNSELMKYNLTRKGSGDEK
jgi:hypothetical protein